MACHHRIVDRSISAPCSIFTFPPSVLQISPDLILCSGSWGSAFVIESPAVVGVGGTWPPAAPRSPPFLSSFRIWLHPTSLTAAENIFVAFCSPPLGLLPSTWQYVSIWLPRYTSNTDTSSLVSALKWRQFPTKTQFSNVLGCHLASSNSVHSNGDLADIIKNPILPSVLTPWV